MFSLSKAWVKNVYSLCADYGVKCVHIYTGSRLHTTKSYSYSAQPQLYTQLTTIFTPQLYTAFLSQFNLLNNRLYTLSTAPIINEKRLKIRKDS